MGNPSLDAEHAAEASLGGDDRVRREEQDVGTILPPAEDRKPVQVILDRVGRLWWTFIVLVVAVAIAGEVQGPDAAAVILSAGAALCVVLVGLAARLDRVAQGIAVLVATALGLGTAAILTFWNPATTDSADNPSTAAATGGSSTGRPDLSGARLRGADLAGAQLVAVDLRGADLKGACLRGANLQSADVAGADLRDSDLRGAVLEGVDISAARSWPTAEQQERSDACH